MDRYKKYALDFGIGVTEVHSKSKNVRSTSLIHYTFVFLKPLFIAHFLIVNSGS